MFDLFTVGKNLKGFADELSGIRVQIEEVQRSIEDVNFAPLPDSDVLEMFRTWAERGAVEYREHLKGVISGIRSRPTLDAGEFHRHLSTLELLPEPTMHRPLSHDKKMCGLLGPDAVVALLKSQMQAMEFPAPGLPKAERAKALEALEKKLAKLKAREAALLAEAEKIGLNVS
jgi:hypothetical protein